MSTDAQPGVESTEKPVYVDSEAHLQQVVEAHDVVLVDFFADWCGPCQMIEPVLEGIAAETSAVIAKVDVDQHQALAGSFGVRGVPTLLLYADGEQVEQQVGVMSADQLRSMIEQYSS